MGLSSHSELIYVNLSSSGRICHGLKTCKGLIGDRSSDYACVAMWGGIVCHIAECAKIQRSNVCVVSASCPYLRLLVCTLCIGIAHVLQHCIGRVPHTRCTNVPLLFVKTNFPGNAALSAVKMMVDISFGHLQHDMHPFCAFHWFLREESYKAWELKSLGILRATRGRQPKRVGVHAAVSEGWHPEAVQVWSGENHGVHCTGGPSSLAFRALHARIHSNSAAVAASAVTVAACSA